MATYKIYNYDTITLNNSVSDKIITTSMFGDTQNNSTVYFGLKDIDNNYINKLTNNTYKIVSDENENAFAYTDNTVTDYKTAYPIKLTIPSLSSNALLTFKYNGTVLFKVNYQKQNRGRIIFLRPFTFGSYYDNQLSDYNLYMIYNNADSDLTPTISIPYDSCNLIYTLTPNNNIYIKNIFYYYDLDDNFMFNDSYTWEELDNIYHFTFIDGTLDIRGDSSYYDAGLINLRFLSIINSGTRVDNILKYFDDDLKPKTKRDILHAYLYRAYSSDGKYHYLPVSSWHSYISQQSSASNKIYGIYYYNY